VQKFELNASWLSLTYKKFRNKIRQSAAYVAATANLNKQKAEQMQQTNAASSAERFWEEAAVVSSSHSRFARMRMHSRETTPR